MSVTVSFMLRFTQDISENLILLNKIRKVSFMSHITKKEAHEYAGSVKNIRIAMPRNWISSEVHTEFKPGPTELVRGKI